ncbi:MAG: hypothetical protein AAB530_01710 [Patescibacteria group bacterium]
MTIKTRQIICIFLYLIFLIITPLIIIFAAGYKFNFNKNKIIPFSLQKTGMFILDSQPPNAKIFINNQIQQNLINKIFSNKTNNITTPAKIKNLLPEEYTVKLELASYWPWEKKLRITSGNSTYAENIFLFKQSSPILIKTTKINDLQLSPSKEKLAILSNDQLSLLNLMNDTEQKTSLQTEEKSLSWSADSQKIILTNSAYDANNLNNKIAPNNLADKNITKLSSSEVLSMIKKNNNIKYADLVNDSKLIYANDFEIWLNDLTNKKQTLITRISDNITGIVWHPNNNYIIYSTDKTINALEMDEREKRSNTELIKFDKISSLLINQKGTILYFQAKIGDQYGLYKLYIQ